MLDGPDTVVTNADLALVEVLLRGEWADQYDEAWDVLMKGEASHDRFPATRFRRNLAAARLASRQGRRLMLRSW